jgi:phosphoribosyl-AMP cyclohydrolase / phosphoribosyl-ATP pyrophosphohydrolase
MDQILPDQLKFDNEGLIPAIIQDSITRQVLMLGYMNRESIKKTMDTGYVTFFSRSRQTLWTKGETSGNTLGLETIQIDCDSDALLIFAKPYGPTCHTGNTSCFFKKDLPDIETYDFLIRLENLLRKRKAEMPEDSYTSAMFAKGLDKISQKVGEEAVETVIASKNESADEFISEASDLLFHLMLLMVQKEIPFSALIEELQNRHR